MIETELFSGLLSLGKGGDDRYSGIAGTGVSGERGR